MKTTAFILGALLATCWGALAAFGIFQVGGSAAACWTTGADGWTVLCTTATTSGSCSAGTANGTCIVYVSSSVGTATCTPQAPPLTASPPSVCDTVAHGLANVRDAKPDWIAFKAGDTWTESFGSLCFSGISSTQPILLTSYGSGARPIFQTTNDMIGTSGAGCGAGKGDYIAMVGLDFYAYKKDPANGSYDATVNDQTGVSWLNPSNWVLLEDMRIRFFKSGFSFQESPPSIRHKSVNLRRSIFVDAYSNTTTDSSGGFTTFSGALLLEENLFDSNGWNATLTTPASVTVASGTPGVVTWTSNKLKNDAGISFTTTANGITANTEYYVRNLSGSTFNIATTPGGSGITFSGSGSMTAAWNGTSSPIASSQRHNIYIAEVDDAGLALATIPVIRGNIFANASSDAQFRLGGNISNNLFVQNPLAHNLGMPLAGSNTVTNNVYLEGVDRANALNATSLQGQGAMTFSIFHLADYPFNVGTLSVTNNIIAHTVTTSGAGYGITLDPGTNAATVSSNIICDWQAPVTTSTTGSAITFGTFVTGGTPTNGTYTNVSLSGGTGSGAVATVTVAGNQITNVVVYNGGNQDLNFGSGYLVNDTLSGSVTGGTFTTKVSAIGVNTISGNSSKVANCNATGWTGSEPGGPDHNRTVGGYYASIGNPGGFPSTTAGFLSAARGQTKATWNTALMGNAVNNYIRAGFGL